MIPKGASASPRVDFPIAVVGGHSLAEGTPNGYAAQLHLWWA